MANNIDIEAERAAEQLEEFARTLGVTATELSFMSAEELRAHKAWVKYQAEYNARLDKAGVSIVNFGKSVGNFGEKLLKNGDSFAILNDTVSAATKFVGGLASAIPV